MKFPKLIKYLIMCIVFLFISACTAKPKEPMLVSIQVDSSTVTEDLDVDDFDLSDILIVLNFSDGTSSKIPLSSSMLSNTDIQKLSMIGTHTISVNYKTFSTSFNINLIYPEVRMKMYLIYQLAVQTQSTTLSFDEWVDSIRGEDGVGILNASINNAGHLIISLTNDSQMDVGKVVGTDGKQVIFQIASKYLQWKYQGDSIWNNLIFIDDLVGKDGISIDNAEINNKGELILTYSNQSVQNLGTLYQSYIVQFKGINGVVLDTQMIISGQSAVAPTIPIIEGHIFTSWSDDFETVTSNLIINAQYTRLQFSIEFETDSTISIDPIEEIQYNESVILPTPTKEGYVFLGWFLGLDTNSMPFYNESPIKENLTLYAKWKLGDHIVTFLDYDLTLLKVEYVTHNMSASPPQSPQRTGYRFVGWDESFIQIVTNTTITATYELGRYTVYFESEGGSSLVPILNVIYGGFINLPITTKQDYDLLGWEYQGLPFTNQTPMPPQDIILTAVWVDHFYQLNFDENTGNAVPNIEITRYSIVSTLPTPNKTGFVFEGWMMNNQIISAPFEYTYGNDVTLTAKWRGTVNNIEYILMDGWASIIGYYGSATTLVLPDTIDGIIITKIGNSAFLNKSLLTNVTIGKHVRSIGNDAFRYCGSLTNITLSKETIELGTYVFFGTNNLSTVTLSSKMGYELKYLFGDDIANIPSSLTKIIYANGETTLDKTLLKGYLPNIILQTASDMTNIPDYYFTDATSLKSITLTSGITSIGRDAFRNTQLTSIVIPSTVINIEQGAFYGLTSMTSLEFALNSNLNSIGINAFYGNTGLTELYLPSSLKKILSSAFAECINLTVVHLEENNQLEEIGSMAFYNNAKINNFGYAPNLTQIGSLSFYNNDELEYFVIPDSVTTLGMNAFALCYDLTIFAEPLTKPAIWTQTFNPGGRPIYWGFEDFAEGNGYQYVLFITGQAGILGLSTENTNVNLIIPTAFGDYTTTSIIAKAFYNNTTLQTINLPYTIHDIGQYAFYGTTELTSVTFTGTSNLKKIEMYAFYNATKLETFDFPTGLEFIGVLAFRSTKLSSVVIPSTITTLEFGVFENCVFLQSVTFAEGSALTSIGSYAFMSNKFEFIIIPETVTQIGSFAFSSNNNLVSIVIPASVQTVGQKAFYSNNNLSIYIQSQTIPSGWHADWNFSNSPLFTGVGDMAIDYNLRVLVLSDNTWAVIQVIDKTVTDLIIPTQINSQPVHSISKGALRTMSNLINLTLPFVGSNRYAFGEEALFGYIFGTTFFSGSTATLQYYSSTEYKSYFIPNSLTYVSVTNTPNIEYGAFYNCYQLNSVVLHAGVVSIGANAFKGCSNVTIFANVAEQPVGWDALWNPNSRPVVWS
jgi:uncharacterized repeat protein (TIGR02543 family)